MSRRPSMTPLGPVGQVGILVADIREAEPRYSTLFGLADWQRYRYDADFVPVREYRGAQGMFSMNVALAGASPQIELIESLEGPSVYEEHLAAGGSGLHHVGVFVESLDAAIAAMAATGFPVVQLGRGYGLDGDGGFAYFDTLKPFGVLIEAIERPRRRRDPIRWD